MSDQDTQRGTPIPVEWPATRDDIVDAFEAYDVDIEAAQVILKSVDDYVLEEARRIGLEVIGEDEPSNFIDDDGLCSHCQTYVEEPRDGEAKCFCELRNRVKAAQRQRLESLTTHKSEEQS